MAGATRYALAVLTLLVLSSVPVAVADESDQVSLVIVDQSVHQKNWFVEGDVLSILPSFINSGDQTAVDNDPSCGVVLQVYDSLNTQIIDETSRCRGQSQSLDLASGEEYFFDAQEWNLTKDDGSFVWPGEYTIHAYHPATELRTSTTIVVQTSVDISSELELLLQINTRDGEIRQDEEVVASVTLVNPSVQSIPLPDLDGCQVEFNVNGHSTLAMKCFDDFQTVEPYEHILLGHVLLEDSSLQIGMNTLQVSFPSGDLLSSLSFSLEEVEPIDTSLQSMTTVEIISPKEIQHTYTQGEIFSSTLQIKNIADDSALLQFTDSCRAEVWIFNAQGEIVFDSRLFKSCNALQLDSVLDSGEILQFTLPDWTFTDLLGCEVSSGKYTVVAEVPEHHLSSSETIVYHQSQSSNCGVSPGFEILPEIHPSELGFNLSITLVPNGPGVDLIWIDSCGIEVSIIDLSTVEEVIQQPYLCDIPEHRHFILPYQGETNSLRIDGGEVFETLDDTQFWTEGRYQIILDFQTSQEVRASFGFTWPIAQEAVIIQPTAEAVIEQQSRLVSGSWSGLQTEIGTCWMLESIDEGQLLLSSALVSPWTPHQGLSGTYEIVDSPAHPACSMFQAPSFQIRALQYEIPLKVTESVEQSDVQAEPEQISDIEQSIATSTVIVAVVSTSLFTMLFAAVLSNESLRIPSTAAGLWFLGLVGRTHETTDGRYQRGRLMGYLTANPGCHFRALMAALDMSNGQITHHLRILESEETIWRRKDGRLVRYYPLTNSLYPGMAEADLPIPPLSPDPNSLQGKILTLLDQDGPLGEFPTQAELANRLEKSQQLVSHHLRTLQKFGLVEKRKMGLKNRYKLTREAIFLLETNTDFSRDD